MYMKRIVFFSFLLVGIYAEAQLPKNKAHAAIQSAKLKRYTNKLLGCSFQYPANWVESGKPLETRDLDNKVRSVSVSFIDDKLKLKFTLEYFPAPPGKKLYEEALNQYESSQGWYSKDSRETKVDGSRALIANLESKLDGKGNELSTPITTQIAMFLDKQQAGLVKLQMSVPNDQTTEMQNFNKVLSSFEFLDKL